MSSSTGRETRPRPPSRSGATCCSASRALDRKSTRLNSSHTVISYAVFCLKKKKKKTYTQHKNSIHHSLITDINTPVKELVIIHLQGTSTTQTHRMQYQSLHISSNTTSKT